MKKFFCLAMLVNMPVLHGMSKEESAEVVALMKVLEFCITKPKGSVGPIFLSGFSNSENTSVPGKYHAENCLMSEERLHAILAKGCKSVEAPRGPIN
jgi:hypothetical protein